MKFEVLCGPVEYGLRWTREEGDGLAWDLFEEQMRAWKRQWEYQNDLDLAKLLGYISPEAVPEVDALLPDRAGEEREDREREPGDR